LLAAVLFISFTWNAAALAQWAQPVAGDLSSAIRGDEIDPAARALLERVKANVALSQWDDAIDTLRQVAEQQANELIRIDSRRFIPVREYCQMRLAELPETARALYRSRVDPLAKRWYDEGIAGRDPEPLRRVVEQLFLSSWTDKALLALGDMTLEEGDFAQARWDWERISPKLRTADGRPLWLDLRAMRAGIADSTPHPRPLSRKWRGGTVGASAQQAATAGAGLSVQWLAYPDSKLNLADVRARLVLASILEGSTDRARIELAELNRRDPGARGTIGGRTGAYSQLLGEMLSRADRHTAVRGPTDWPTMAGSFDRTLQAEPEPGLHTAWAIKLPLNPAGAFRSSIGIVRESFGLPARRPAEDQANLLSFHPLIVGNLVLLNTLDKIYAFDLSTGKPAWPVPPDTKDREPGEIYSGLGADNAAVPLPHPDDLDQFHTFGVPRFTMSVVNNRLYARLGSPITGRPQILGLGTGGSYLVCLDLASQGRLQWRIPQSTSEDDRWAYEGSPVCDGNNVYVAMRYNDVQPQEHVACYDAQTGTLRWRRLICAAESPARGQAEEISNNLLTLDHDMLYLNTNLGAVAAIAASDGQIRWLSLYPRAKPNAGGVDPPANFYRDLNPCVFYRGDVLVAPTDCIAILSFDSASGQLLWASTTPRDVVHLLGVGGGNLLASGQRLWWLNVDSGKVLYRWPDQTTVHGYGRGGLVDDVVYFPTRTEIHVFRQSLTPRGEASPGGPSVDFAYVETRNPIRLDTRDPPLSGGNLVSASGYLLIATPNRLIALGPHRAAAPIEPQLTQLTTKSKPQAQP
jgi:hypothetical protein